MTYINNLILLEMYIVGDSDRTVWWDLHWEAQGEVSLIKANLYLFMGRENTETRKGKFEDAKKT